MHAEYPILPIQARPAYGIGYRKALNDMAGAGEAGGVEEYFQNKLTDRVCSKKIHLPLKTNHLYSPAWNIDLNNTINIIIPDQ